MFIGSFLSLTASQGFTEITDYYFTGWLGKKARIASVTMDDLNSFEAVFDPATNEIYRAVAVTENEVFSYYKNEKCRQKYCEGIITDSAEQIFYSWILFYQKMESVLQESCPKETLELDIEQETWIELSHRAHENSVTMNEYIMKAIITKIEEDES